MDNLDSIIYYLYNNEKYLDFQTIMYIIDKDKTFTWRLLVKLDIPFVNYLNRRLYKFENLMESVEIVDLLDIEKLNL